MDQTVILKNIESDTFINSVDSALADIRRRSESLVIVTTYMECGAGITVELSRSKDNLPAGKGKELVLALTDRLSVLVHSGRATTIIYKADENTATLQLSFI